jgi:predicted MFS family arabinose efflux permease
MATFDASAARGLLADGGWRRWAVVASLARMPAVMAPFGLLLAGHEATGSYADGAWMVSVYAAGAAAAAPFRGRSFDRSSLAGALRRVLVHEALLLAALAVAAAARAPLPALLALSLGFGVVPAGVMGGVRAMLSSIVGSASVESAFAIDAAMLELLWVLGPLFVGASAALGAPLASLALMALCALVAAALTGRLPASAKPKPSPGRLGGLWQLPGVLTILVVSLAFGISWGALEAGVPPRLEQLGAKAAFWGVLSALLAASSAIGGVVYAVAPKADTDASARRRIFAFAAAWAALLLPVAWARQPLTLAVWFTSAGFVLAPLSAQLTASLQRALPSSRHAEGFAVYGACWSAGMATGTALAGAILDRWGPVRLLAFAPLLPFVAASAGVFGRRRRAPG